MVFFFPVCDPMHLSNNHPWSFPDWGNQPHIPGPSQATETDDVHEDLSDRSQQVRASALRAMASIKVLEVRYLICLGS